MHTVRRPARVLAAALAAVALAASGCGSDDDSGGGDEQVTLNVQMFGNFGYQEAGLLDEYQQLHRNVKIEYSSIQQESEYWPKVQSQLNASSGPADVYGMEVVRIAEVTQNQADRWVDLRQFGAADLEKNYYPFKWKAGVAGDGRILGLGTDIGPIAICYRKDLFAQAGLPTDRNELSTAWTSWEAYLEMGRRYKANAPKGSAFVDTANGLYSAVLGGSEEQYYAENGELVYETNPAVKRAWDLTVSAIQAGLTAKLSQFDPEWNKAFASGGFASIECPSWMLGYIKGQDAKGAGKWDVAKGPGVGNWGGSYLGIPANSKKQQAAYDLISWLTAPQQQAKLFGKQGIFPATKVGAELPEVADATDPYFNDAPIGQIFGEVAKQLPVATLGPNDGKIRDAFGTGLLTVDKEGKSPDEAWRTTLKNIANAIG